DHGQVIASPSVEPKRILDDPQVNLQRLEPRAVPLTLPDRREVVKPRAGGTIWITDDGSSLAQALRAELSRRGYLPRVIAIGDTHAPAPGEELCGLIVLASAGRCPAGFIADAFRTIRAAGPVLERSGERGATLLTVSRLDGRFGVEGLWPEID